MAITVIDITVTIGSARSNQFNIDLAGGKFNMANFSLSQRLLDHASLYFDMHKGPEESISDTQFQVCSDIIGKEITLSVKTGSMERDIQTYSEGDENGLIEFSGFITGASACRNPDANYYIRVEAQSWDAQLEDSPDVMLFRDKALADIVKDELLLADNIDAEIAPAYTDTLSYCTKWNETTWGFLSRLAIRHGEWLFSDGQKLYFGKLPSKEEVRLQYPGKSLISYSAGLHTQHVRIGHTSANYFSGTRLKTRDTYGEYGDTCDKMDDHFNDLNEAVYNASTERYQRLTMQAFQGSGLPDPVNGNKDEVAKWLKPMAHGLKSSLLNYNGRSACSRLSVGCKLVVVDNFINDSQTNTKSDVPQEEILITSIVHTFGTTDQYENSFQGLSGKTVHPPYTNPTAVPRAFPTRAIVMNNKDPERLGRVKVGFPTEFQKNTVGANAHSTPWIRVEQRYAYAFDIGMYIVPEWGSEVIVDFEQGNAELPYVRSCVYNGNFGQETSYVSSLPNKEWTKEDKVAGNQVKAIRTHSGHTIEIHDEGEDGVIDDKGYIKIYNAHEPHYEILLSSNRNLIRLRSQGNIELDAKHDILMSAGGDIKVTAKGNISSNSKGQTDITAFKDMTLTTQSDLKQIARIDMTTTVDGSLTENVKFRIKQNAQWYDLTCSKFIDIKSDGTTKVVSGDDLSVSANKNLICFVHGNLKEFVDKDTTITGENTLLVGRTSLKTTSPNTKEN